MATVLLNEPRDLLLGDDNDLVITTDLVWARGMDAIVQQCRIALQMLRDEWFLDLDEGIPYWDGILGAKPAIAVALARDEFRRALLAVDGVRDVTRLDVVFDRRTRTLRVDWQVRTVFGESPVDTLAPGGLS
ncbi:MAG: hypothetical protein ACTHU0_25770 [Kofleriaceae bacterium]